MLFNFLIFTSLCYGLSNMVIYSKGPFRVFERWRNLTERIHPDLGELFNCMLCFPFWVGLLLSAIDMFILGGVLTPLNVIVLSKQSMLVKALVFIFDGAIGSATTWVIHNIEEHYEQ